MHISSFKMPTIRQVWHLIEQSNYAFFSVDLKDAFLHIPIVKNHHHFSWFVWQWKVLSLGLLGPLGILLHLLNPYCSFAGARVFMLKYME